MVVLYVVHIYFFRSPNMQTSIVVHCAHLFHLDILMELTIEVEVKHLNKLEDTSSTYPDEASPYLGGLDILSQRWSPRLPEEWKAHS